MKLLRYGPPGQEKPGLLDAQGGIRDLSAHIGDIAGQALSPEGLAELAAIDPASLPLVAGDPRLGACVGQVGKFICIGLNYADHAAETGAAIAAMAVIPAATEQDDEQDDDEEGGHGSRPFFRPPAFSPIGGRAFGERRARTVGSRKVTLP